MGPGVTELAERVAEVRARIADAAARAGRHPDEVTLVAVTKGVPPDRIRAAVAAGLTELGESRVQEAAAKIRTLGPVARWHLVGHLQRNKVRQAARLFSCIHAVDRPDLARELDRRLERDLAVLLQVNVAGEPQKFGVPPAALPILAAAVAGCARLRVVGLMTIAPLVDDPELVRPVFSRLRVLRDELNQQGLLPEPLHHLSMGMSDDFEVAVEEGATLVRIGRAIFGPPQKSAGVNFWGPRAPRG